MVTVALVGNDGHRVSVPMKLASYSKTISAVLAPYLDPAENTSNDNMHEEVTFTFPSTIPANQAVLDEVVRYMAFKQKWEGDPDSPRFDIKLDILHDLTIVADYLDI